MMITSNRVQEMCDRVAQRFPYISPWEIRLIKINQLRTSLEKEKDVFVRESMTAELQKLRDEYIQKRAFNKFITIKSMNYLDRPVQFYKYLIDNIDFFKTFWCGAAAKIMYMVCRMNGVEENDVERSFVVLDDGMTRLQKELCGETYQPKRLDHVVNKVKTQEGTIEADPLLNKTYREGEMRKVLESDFKNAFALKEYDKIRLCSEKEFPQKFNDMPHLKEEQKEQLAELYPDLLI